MDYSQGIVSGSLCFADGIFGAATIRRHIAVIGCDAVPDGKVQDAFADRVHVPCDIVAGVCVLESGHPGGEFPVSGVCAAGDDFDEDLAGFRLGDGDAVEGDGDFVVGYGYLD